MAQKQILRKLYLTASWGLAAFGIAVIGATTAFQGSEYVRDCRAVDQWEAEYGDQGWEVEEIGKDEAAALRARARTSGFAGRALRHYFFGAPNKSICGT